MYDIQEKYTRRGALCPGTFLLVLMIWAKELRCYAECCDFTQNSAWHQLLEDPVRLEREYRQRLLTTDISPELKGLETSRGKFRQGIARLIDSYQFSSIFERGK